MNHYVIEVIIKQEFSALKDVEATSKEEAIKKAKQIALDSFCKELYDNIWYECNKPEVVSFSIEDEYPL